MSENPENSPQPRTAAASPDPQTRLIVQDNGQICIGLQRPGEPHEVVLTIADIAAIAETLDEYQQHGYCDMAPRARKSPPV